TEADDVSFVLFADANRNQYYEKPGEFLERYLIRGDFPGLFFPNQSF
ncbi:MAG: hypothetical protein CEO19_484, partial [Parcubacteria group bacterium Gr01-1014_73]